MLPSLATSSLLLWLTATTTRIHSVSTQSTTTNENGILVLQNARIYTLDEANPWAEALAMDRVTGLLLAVGSQAAVDASVDAFLLDQTQQNTTATVVVVDVQARLVLPGFHDAHIHAVEAGINRQLCLLDEDAPLDELDFHFVVDEEFCPTGGALGDQDWVVGAGLDLALLLDDLKGTTDPNQSPIAFMDAFSPDKPAFILDTLGHGALANTLALEAVGFTQLATNENPPGGLLHQDAQGTLTGIVLENAQQPLRNAAFPPTAANQQLAYDSLLKTLPILARRASRMRVAFGNKPKRRVGSGPKTTIT
jgi:predicted amidohydrolase YtcJ